MLITIWHTLKDLNNFAILLLIYIYVYTIVGMELFANKAKFNSEGNIDFSSAGESPEQNFDNIGNAFITVFCILAIDGWLDVFLNYYRAVGITVSSFYFLSLLIMG